MTAGNHTRLLCHYLPADDAAEALDTGVIRSRAVEGVDVVWLSEVADLRMAGYPPQAAGPHLSDPSRRLMRFTVAVPDAQHWPIWAEHHRVHRRARRSLDARGDGMGNLWWVVARPVPSSEWLLVEDDTGRILWRSRPPLASSLVPTR